VNFVGLLQTSPPRFFGCDFLADVKPLRLRLRWQGHKIGPQGQGLTSLFIGKLIFFNSDTV